MSFRIKPGMLCWPGMSKNYKKEYHIYASKMEKRKFKNDRKMIQKEKPKKKKILSFYEKNQKKLEKIWLKEMSKLLKIKRQRLRIRKSFAGKINKTATIKEKQWFNWMEY